MAGADPRTELAAVNRWLLDTGPLVAYLDANDRAHEEIVHCLEPFVGRLLTTSAVITESMYFVAGSEDGVEAIAEFVAVNRVAIRGSERPPELRAAATLMRRYGNLPMDYADATLLLLADGADVDSILTLDRRGFAAYRTPAGKALRLVLDG